MCGRFTLRAPASVIAEQFALFEMPPFTPSFNIAPTQPVAAVRLTPEKIEPRREAASLHWGLIPSWAKDRKIGSRMINARAETVAEKPAFRAAFRRRRCLVPADGFYEWHGSGRRKQPYFIHREDDGPFAFAGLWEHWESPDGSYVESCTLVTTEANELMAPIHHRMPVILRPEHYGRWLDREVEEPGELLPLLVPYAGEDLDLYPVSTHVNSPANDDPKCIAREGLF